MLQHKFWLKTVSFVAAEILTCQTYKLFFPYISWDKYHHTWDLFIYKATSLAEVDLSTHCHMYCRTLSYCSPVCMIVPIKCNFMNSNSHTL